MKLGMILLSGLLCILGDQDECLNCHLENQYLCAANTLPVNSRICIDISEVPVFFYKDFLADMAEEFGVNSERFERLLPNFEIWIDLLPHLNSEEIKNKFFETDDLALMPLVGITLDQAEQFCEWRTEVFKAELAEMDTKDRANFPNDFKFRLPTAAEWGRLRFLHQDKRMMKRLGKIASNNRSAFKAQKSIDMAQLRNIGDVYKNQHEPIGFFNLLDNVSEMTSEKGIAMGGSYYESNTKGDFQKTFNYKSAHAWLGIRCVFEIID